MTLFYRTVCSYIFYTLLVAVGVTFLVLFIQLLERATSAAAPDIGALFWYLLLDSPAYCARTIRTAATRLV